MSTISVLAAKSSLTGPLASPEHWTASGAPAMIGELASRMKDLNPNDSRNLARVGELQLRAGLIAEAGKTFTKALESDGKDDEACRIIASPTQCPRLDPKVPADRRPLSEDSPP